MKYSEGQEADTKNVTDSRNGHISQKVHNICPRIWRLKSDKNGRKTISQCQRKWRQKMEHTQKQTKPAKKQFHNVKGNGDKNGTHPKMDKISKKYTKNV